MITNLIDFDRLYSILHKYLEIYIKKSQSERPKELYSINEIYKVFKDTIYCDRDLFNNSKYTKYSFLNDLLSIKAKVLTPKQLKRALRNKSNKIACLMIFLMIRNENLLKENDISISIKNVLMYINKILNNFFDMGRSYTLLVDKKANDVHVIGWNNRDYAYITTQNVKSSYFIKKGNEMQIKGLYFYIYPKDLVNCDYSITFLFEKKINKEEENLLNVIFSCICEFYSKNLPIIVSRNYLNEKKIYNRELLFKIQEDNGNVNLILDASFRETEINILHLSDLHFTNQTKDSQPIDFLKKYKKQNLYLVSPDSCRDNQKIHRIDLIIITGDVIFAGKSTKVIYKNYLQALEKIEIIASNLLGNVWRDRVIIIPGNHDYGMINEVRVDMLGRSYNSSVIDTEISTEQEKFVFFRLLFDGIMKENGNNALYKTINKFDIVRYEVVYDENKENQFIQFLVFNTAKNSNAIISNKTTLELEDSDFKDIEITKPTLFLMHHTPLFNINYYRDIFSSYDHDYLNLLYGTTDKEICSVNIAFGLKNLIDNATEKRDKAKKAYEKYIKIILKKIESKNNELHKLIDDSRTNEDAQKKAKDIFQKNEELKMYLDENNATNDEFFLNRRYTFSLHFLQTTKDKENYKKSINLIKDKFKNIIILGGHEHKQCAGFSENIKVFEVGLLNHYGLLKFKLDNSNYFYSDYYSSVKMIETTEKPIWDDKGKIYIEDK